MEDQEAEEIIKEIKTCLRIGRDDKLTPSETFGLLEGILPTKIEYVEKPLKTSPEQLEYLKKWRKAEKELKRLSEELGQKKKAGELKISNSKKRTGFTCYNKNCPKTSIKVSPLNNKHVLKRIVGSRKLKIIISNRCPYCGGFVKAFGGYIDPE